MTCSKPALKSPSAYAVDIPEMARKPKKPVKSKVSGKEVKWHYVLLVLLVAAAAIKIMNPDKENFNQVVKKNIFLNLTTPLIWPAGDSLLSHEVGVGDGSGVWISKGSAGYLILGPHVNIAPGVYSLGFELKLEDSVGVKQQAAVVQLSHKNGNVIFSKDINASELSYNGFRNFSYVFASSLPLEDVEFRVKSTEGINIGLKQIMLSSQPNSWPANSSLFSHEIGHDFRFGMWTSGLNTSGHVISSGPHIILAPGPYEISYVFYMRGPASSSDRVAVIEVANRGSVFLSGGLTDADFNLDRDVNADVIKSFVNRFKLEAPMDDVEFMLYYQNNSLEVVLKEIVLILK